MISRSPYALRDGTGLRPYPSHFVMPGLTGHLLAGPSRSRDTGVYAARRA